MNQFKLSITVLCMAAVGLACEKEGPAGPEGPQGEQGERGPKGEQGPRGRRGPAGAANVMYSDWMDFDLKSEDGSPALMQRITEERVTKKFVNEGGLVLFYIREVFGEGHSNIIPLPLIYGNAELTGGMSSDKQVWVGAFSTDGKPVNVDLDNFQFRYILIPGGVNISASAREDLRLKSYEEVARTLNLPD